MSKLEPRDHVYLANFQRLVKVQVEPHRCVLWFDDGSLITVQSVWRNGPGDPSLGVTAEHPSGQPGPLWAQAVPDRGSSKWRKLYESEWPSRETRALYQCACGFPCREAGKGCPQCGDPGVAQDGQSGQVSYAQVRSELDQPLTSVGQPETEAGREVGNADAAEAGRPVGWAHMQKPIGNPGQFDQPAFGPWDMADTPPWDQPDADGHN